MPTNKNAFIRYKYLDKLLSDRHHYYDMRDLAAKVNSMLEADGFKPVTRRCIEKDVENLTFTPFCADIETFKMDGKTIYRYRRQSFSIFREELSREEVSLLREVLNTIGQFKGLDHFEWLDRLKSDLGLKSKRSIISFSNNPNLQNSNLLSTLFDVISNEVAIRLSYHTFSDETIRAIEFHPYLLKQYNDRWFLIGAADSDKKILNFPLDRIDKVEALPQLRFVPCTLNLQERFEDIVGVTFHEDYPVEHILFWVSDASRNYIITKPIHESQKQYHGEREQQLRAQYPTLESGTFFSIDCIRNYELIRELCAYGKDLIVLHSDGTVAEDVRKRVHEMAEQYENVTK